MQKEPFRLVVIQMPKSTSVEPREAQRGAEQGTREHEKHSAFFQRVPICQQVSEREKYEADDGIQNP